jgi:hypothetical protein
VPGQTPIGNKNYYGTAFEQALADAGIRPLRQAIESVSDSSKAPSTSNLRRPHPGRDCRVPQRIPVLTAAIWQNDANAQPTLRSLVACDH